MKAKRRAKQTSAAASGRLARQAVLAIQESRRERDSGKRLLAIAREWEAAYGTVRRALREALDPSGGEPRPFWTASGSLELDTVHLDVARRRVAVKFRGGREVSLPLSALRLTRRPVAARLDDLRHAVILELSNGEVEEVASDLFLHETDVEYRVAHGAPCPPPPVGPRMRELRIALGLKAAEVARAAGLAPSNYARLEAGRHEPRVDTLVRVAAALQLPLWSLFRGAGSPAGPRLTRAQAAQLLAGTGGPIPSRAARRAARSPGRRRRHRDPSRDPSRRANRITRRCGSWRAALASTA